MRLTKNRQLLLCTSKASAYYDNEDNCISIFDHTDDLNQPAAYTRLKRKIPKAIKDIEALPAQATFDDLFNVLENNELQPRRWCMVD